MQSFKVLPRLCLLLAVAVTACLIVLNASAEIYVIRNKDGSVTFTNRTPRPGQNAEIFKPSTESWSRSATMRLRDRGHLFKNEYAEIIRSVALRVGIDPSLIRAVIHAESAFDPRARSPKGAMGLMQLMPDTARLVGVNNPYEPHQNVNGGATYLKSMLNRYGGDVRRALAAYNSGPQNVDNFKGIPPFTETRLYVKRVMDLHRAYSAAAHGLPPA